MDTNPTANSGSKAVTAVFGKNVLHNPACGGCNQYVRLVDGYDRVVRELQTKLRGLREAALADREKHNEANTEIIAAHSRTQRALAQVMQKLRMIKDDRDRMQEENRILEAKLKAIPTSQPASNENPMVDAAKAPSAHRIGRTRAPVRMSTVAATGEPPHPQVLAPKKPAELPLPIRVHPPAVAITSPASLGPIPQEKNPFTDMESLIAPLGTLQELLDSSESTVTAPSAQKVHHKATPRRPRSSKWTAGVPGDQIAVQDEERSKIPEENSVSDTDEAGIHRPKRTAARPRESYAEPPLNKRLRKGDPHTHGYWQSPLKKRKKQQQVVASSTFSARK